MSARCQKAVDEALSMTDLSGTLMTRGVQDIRSRLSAQNARRARRLTIDFGYWGGKDAFDLDGRISAALEM